MARRRRSRLLPRIKFSGATLNVDLPYILKILGYLALIAGLFFLGRGVYGFFTPPIDVATYRIILTFNYQGSLADFLAGRALDTFTLKEANAYLIEVARYDSSSNVKFGVVESTWPQCNKSLAVSIYVDDHGYGPYCHEPLFEILTGQTSVEFLVNTEPGPHTIKVFVTYNGRPLATKVFTVSAPTYEEALKTATE